MVIDQDLRNRLKENKKDFLEMAERIVSRQLAARIFSRLLRIALEQIRSGQLDVEGADVFNVHLGQGTGDGFSIFSISCKGFWNTPTSGR